MRVYLLMLTLITACGTENVVPRASHADASRTAFALKAQSYDGHWVKPFWNSTVHLRVRGSSCTINYQGGPKWDCVINGNKLSLTPGFSLTLKLKKNGQNTQLELGGSNISYAGTYTLKM